MKVVIKFLKSLFSKNPTSWILAVVAIITLFFTYKNIELVNRPFVSIENVYWRQEKDSDWFMSGFKMKNYGNKPAQDFSIANVRIMVMNIDKEALVGRLRQDKKEIPEQYFQEWLLDFRNKVYWGTVKLFSDYFYSHPDATKLEVTKFIKSWNKILPKDSILRYKEGLLINPIEVNNDMFDYFSKTSLLVYPNQENAGGRYTQQMGKGGIAGVEKGDNLLIVHWEIKYKGLINKFLNPFSPQTYSTNYIGYHIEPCAKMIDSTGFTFNILREFRSWSKSE